MMETGQGNNQGNKRSPRGKVFLAGVLWVVIAAVSCSSGSPPNSPPEIQGVSISPPSPTLDDPVTITAAVTDNSAVASVEIHYESARRHVPVPMSPGADPTFEMVLPAQSAGVVINYVNFYIEARDDDGEITLAPENAPIETYSYSVKETSALPVFINEFMAINQTIISDPDFGQYADWIELYNAGESEVDLGGTFLSDDINNPTRWEIPQGTSIPAGGFLLVWADDKDMEGEALHTNFRLDGTEGEELGLFSSIGTGLVPIDTVTFGAQTPDVSMGRTRDGGSDWGYFGAPTPGASNG